MKPGYTIYQYFVPRDYSDCILVDNYKYSNEVCLYVISEESTKEMKNIDSVGIWKPKKLKS